MNNFHINIVSIDNREPYIQIDFEDIVNKDVIKTHLNSLGYIYKANVNDDNYGKVRAIAYLHDDTENVNEIVDKIKEYLNRL